MSQPSRGGWQSFRTDSTAMNERRATLDLAAIGNCSYGALIDHEARLVWSCLPRFDGDPVFCALLSPVGDMAEHGMFAIELEGLVGAEQEYVENTAILVTRLKSHDGSEIEIVDFGIGRAHVCTPVTKDHL